jgi:hypothetical protein
MADRFGGKGIPACPLIDPGGQPSGTHRTVRNACPTLLEVQLQAKLELSRVKRRRWAAVVAAIACSLSEPIDVAE